MDKYKDNRGRYIKPGDVLVYDEGPGYGQSIDLVVDRDGELCGVTMVGEPKWTVLEGEEAIPLRFYKLYPDDKRMETVNAYVVDVPHEEAFTPEFAERVFGR